MKNIYTFLIILLLGITLSSQAQFINYQGVARDNAGNILINQPIALRLSVLSGSAVGTAVYVETHTTNTDGYGLFTLHIGQGSVVTGVFNDIAWSSTSFFLKVEIDPTGGTNYGLAGTTQFAAVPYSLHAKTADNGFSGNYNDLTNQPVLFDGAFGSLTGKPSTLAGYGITDAMNTSHAANAITNGNITNWNTAFAWGNHAGLYRPITYIPTWGEVTGKPVFATVATSGSYNDLANLPVLFNGTWLSLTGKPTTLAGYGITDAMNTSHAANAITNGNITNWNTAFTWGNHAGLYRPIGYVPAWSEITANPFVFSAVANNQLLKYNSGTSKWENWTPNYLTNFTETDPSWTAASPNYYTKTNLQTNGAAALHFNNLTNKPTTLLGYGITDAMNTSHAANGITTTNITNWNTAFAWGNHAGLYRPISYVPAWGEITANPFAFNAVANNQLLKYNATSGNWENWTPNYLTNFTETDPIFGAWDKSSGIVIASSQVSDFATSVTNTPAVLANTAKNSYPTEDAAKLAGIAAGAEVNVNADWNATSGDAQLINKPSLATVATTGSYNDLVNKPTPWDSTWASIKNKPTGTNPGDMLYWNGTTWIAVPVGTTGQVLKLNDAIPTWTSSASLATTVTTAVTTIANTTAISGGNVSDGGALVTARGVCWGTSPNPTTSNSKTTDGNGAGSYVSTLSGLTVATTYFVRAYATNSIGTAYGNEVSFTTDNSICGTSSITINHAASGGVAPVDKTVTYGTVTNVPGETTKCWITKNLGATNQPTSVSDATEAAAGWYWQFNLKQGYKHDGTTITPANTWNTTSTFYETSDWVDAKDPCIIELGSSWRLPTYTEWNNVDASGTWTTWSGPYASSLKLHAAGFLSTSTGTGALSSRGSYGIYYSGRQAAPSYGWVLYFNSGNSNTNNTFGKAQGFSVRCIKN